MTSADSIKTLIDKSKDYLETKIELTKLKTIDKSADVLSAVFYVLGLFPRLGLGGWINGA